MYYSALRYALGRKSTASYGVILNIKDNIQFFSIENLKVILSICEEELNENRNILQDFDIKEIESFIKYLQERILNGKRQNCSTFHVCDGISIRR